MPRFSLWTCIAVPLRWATTGWQCQPPGKHGPVFAGFSPLSLSSPSVLFVIFFSGRRFCLTTSRSDKDVRLLVEFVFRQENSRKWQGNHHRTQPGRRPQPPPTLIPCGFPRHSPVLRVPPGSRHSTKPNGKGCPRCSLLGLPAAELSSLCLVLLSFFVHSKLPAETDGEEAYQTGQLLQLLFCSPVTSFPTASAQSVLYATSSFFQARNKTVPQCWAAPCRLSIEQIGVITGITNVVLNVNVY